MTSPSTKRLLKESIDIHKNPSPYFTAAPISDTNLHDWHFTLAGPPHTNPLRRRPLPWAHNLPTNLPPPTPLIPLPNTIWPLRTWGVRTALLAIRSEIMGGESKGQVGGVESSTELRREYAKVSSEWACRECGVSNGEIMRDWWGICVEKGVEVDVEGLGDADAKKVEEQAGTAATESTSPLPSQPQLQPEQEPETETKPQSQPQPQPQPQPESESESAALVEAPRSPPTAAVTPSTLPSHSSTPPTALQARSVPATATITHSSEPANSPWLDRAIVVIVFALIILILRQTLDVDDL
ncbi:hypothetical protein N7520_007826 [Penicillium odoratum]|uniref:uncharacterized protein n=1 Tax=Penicillium odoratum TaxID=1167516 RepID=UPI0025499EE9|nr:uncharacterized protein N7520_007826 [Penicillium odoratum]KAJ5760670.1 hypothetical protein N7520_007826 [Penicillium odoratum]